MPRKAASGMWIESFDKGKLPLSFLCRCSNTYSNIESWIAYPTTLSGSNPDGAPAPSSKTTLHIPPAHDLRLQMLHVGNYSVSPCLKGTLCWSPHWRHLCLTSGGLWRGRTQSFLCTFLKLEQTLKIHQWEVLWDVFYLSVENFDLSSFCSNLQQVPAIGMSLLLWLSTLWDMKTLVPACTLELVSTYLFY